MALWGAAGSAAGDDPPSQGETRESRDDDLKFASGLYAQRRYDLAAEEYERLLKSNPAEEVSADALFGLANCKLMLARYQEARDLFRSFAKRHETDIRSPDAIYRIGECSALLGETEPAREALADFAKRFPKHKFYDAALVNWGDVDFKRGDFKAAKAHYESALAISKSSRLVDRSRYGLGLAEIDLGEFDAAAKTLETLAETGAPEWRDRAWYQIGRGRLIGERPEEAIAAFETLERSFPKSRLNAQARLDKARALLKLKRYDAALAAIAEPAADASASAAAQVLNLKGRILRAQGKLEQALAAFDGAIAKAGPGGAFTPEPAFHSAEVLRELGKPEQARSRFLKLAQDFPKDPWADDALYQAALLATEAGESGAARNLAGLLTSRYPLSPLAAGARVLEARAALADNQPKEAIAILAACLENDRPNPEVADRARYYLGLAYKKDGQSAKAEEILNTLEGSSAVAADAQFLIGQARYEANDYQGAIAPLERYLKDRQDGDVADHAYAYLAVCRGRLGNPAEAKHALDALKKRFPQTKLYASSALLLAESAYEAKDFETASGWFKAASETPETVVKIKALSGWGWSLYQLKNYDESAQAFQMLTQLAPSDAAATEAHRMRGAALEAEGKSELALEAYASAGSLSKTAEGAAAELARARLLAKLKRSHDAGEAYAKLLFEHPEGAGGVALEAILAELAFARLDAGEGDKADAAFERILSDFPKSDKVPEARLYLAESAYQAKRYDRVEELLAPIVSEGSPAAAPVVVQSALYRMGRRCAEVQDWKASGVYFERLAKEFPAGPYAKEARFWSAEAAFQANEPGRALAAFTDLVASPENEKETWTATARVRRVQCLVQQGKWKEAIGEADAVAKDLTNSALVSELDYARGRAHQGLAEFDLARAAFEKVAAARKQGELAARARLMIGETYFHQKNYKEALRAFGKVEILHTDTPKLQAAALLEMGKVYERLSQWTEAAETYERLRANHPGDPNAEEAGKRLAAVMKRIAAAEAESSRVE